MEPLKKDVFVTMANTLIRATHNLSVAERRVLMIGISKLENKEYTENPRVEVTAHEIAAHASITPEAAYQSAVSADKHLYARSIPLLHDLKTGELKPGKTRWITTSYYPKGRGLIELEINLSLIPYLTQLKQNFTRYNHTRTGEFKSIYSFRLFDLLMQNKSRGELRIKTDELLEVLEAPESLRSNFANLRKRAIEPAIKEIRTKDGLDVKWEPLRKEGRKVVSLVFTFPTEQQKTLPIKQKAAAAKKATKKAAPADNSAAIDAASKAAGEAAMAKLLKPQEKKSTV